MSIVLGHIRHPITMITIETNSGTQTAIQMIATKERPPPSDSSLFIVDPINCPAMGYSGVRVVGITVAYGIGLKG